MKWFGQIAFSNTVEEEPGVNNDLPIVKNYFGDIVSNSKSNQLQDINPNITISNQISVIADPYLMYNFHKILYVTFNGSKWRVNNVKEAWPRLTIGMGSLYSEDAMDREASDDQD